MAPWLEVLGKPLPKDFIRLDRTLFIKKDKSGLDVLVTIKDGVVIHSVLGAAFSSTDEAVVWAAPFYIVFEGIGTYYGQSKSGGDIYKINNAFALIDWLRLRADGLIARAVMFSLDLEYLKVQ
ncbi:hypothetical protein AGMMS50212_12580 [Spirochaetia bacterium]|nr:hypothetical protein AGMMS50212_12580 [Spirochaetia bacterium]